MRVFISSVISGFKEFRDATDAAISNFGHTVIRAEQFGASADSPQVVCLQGVRDSDLVIVIAGARYGIPQSSGLSATHEEFNEARASKPILFFVQSVPSREAAQEAFVAEVRDWAGGVYTAPFSTPQELERAVSRALHEYELAQTQGNGDDAELIARADELIPKEGMGLICVSVASGPHQTIMSPTAFADPSLATDLQQRAFFGQSPILDSNAATEIRRPGGALVLKQEWASLGLDDVGSIVFVQHLRKRTDPFGVGAIIEEDVRSRIQNCLTFAADTLERIDPVRRLRRVVPLVGLVGAGHLPWRTRIEHAASPNSAALSRGASRFTVQLSPAARPRAALAQQADGFAADLTLLLRHQMRPW